MIKPKAKEEVSCMIFNPKKYEELQKLKKQGKIKGNICPVSYMDKKVINIPKPDWRKDKFWKDVNIKTSKTESVVAIDITKEVRIAIRDVLRQKKREEQKLKC